MTEATTEAIAEARKRACNICNEVIDSSSVCYSCIFCCNYDLCESCLAKPSSEESPSLSPSSNSHIHDKNHFFVKNDNTNIVSIKIQKEILVLDAISVHGFNYDLLTDCCQLPIIEVRSIIDGLLSSNGERGEARAPVRYPDIAALHDDIDIPRPILRGLVNGNMQYASDNYHFQSLYLASPPSTSNRTVEGTVVKLVDFFNTLLTKAKRATKTKSEAELKEMLRICEVSLEMDLVIASKKEVENYRRLYKEGSLRQVVVFR